ncbi:MAG: ATP-dependent RNA helicase DbpA [Pseudomonadales bacterium]|nr:ATP-dependent RNA helicase DbpA [Pseudomonadales bacterium]
MAESRFSTLNLKDELLRNLASLGYHDMTPIQAASLPAMLSGKDVVAQAKTGSGKTAAFGLGLLQKLDVARFRVQSLVLCPTRELADQVANEIRRLARGIHNIKVLALCGGTPIGPQLGSLEHGAHIVIGTPGRIDDHLRKGSLKPEDLTTLVLDEADRMLDMGFGPAVEAIIKRLPRKRQTLLFSATYPDGIRAMVGHVMKSPEIVSIDSAHDSDTIMQYLCQVADDADRLDVIRCLLLAYRPDSALVFCNTRRDVQSVAESIRRAGFVVGALHGELDQREREQTLVRFANKSTTVLVATDVAARGLDVDDVQTVINYQIARDTEVHVHRIGRTARAGKQGIAVSLFEDKEIRKVEALEAMAGHAIETLPLLPENLDKQTSYKPPMVTLQIEGGRKQKIRPGDVLGALTSTGSITRDDVGKIHVFEQCVYVGVKRARARDAIDTLSTGKLKGRAVRVRQI